MRGIAYGVGVGPGDPELMTLKAVRLIKENEVIAVPGRDARNSAAYKIAVQAVPELADREIIAVDMPMTRDRAVLEESHRAGAKLLEGILDTGRNVVFLVLGDPTVYCTFTYLQRILDEDGYETRLVSAVTSFCAAAARLNIPLAESAEPLHIYPAAYDISDIKSVDGNAVLMKSGRRIAEVKKLLRASGRTVSAVINCGMEGETVCRGVDEIPDDAGYYTLMIAK